MENTEVTNVHGEVLKIGDMATHEGVGDKMGEIISFRYNERLGEIEAETTEGFAGIDYLTSYTK